jgi:L-rhamnose isomerase
VISVSFAIAQDFIGSENRKREAALTEDYGALSRQLERRGIDIEEVTQHAMSFAVAVPSWGVGTGGTRFARFPGSSISSRAPRRPYRRIFPGTRLPTTAPFARRPHRMGLVSMR